VARLLRSPRLWASVALLAPAAAGCGSTARASDPPILREAKRRDARALAQARRRGAVVKVTGDRRSYYVLRVARGGPTRPVILTLHGYKSYAPGQFMKWYPEAAARDYSLLSLQWKLGATRFLSPRQIYNAARGALRRMGARPGKVLLHGYSSAALRTYQMTAFDRRAARWFALSIADAGGTFSTFQPNRAVFGGAMGRRPLAGSRWVLFCGGRDPHPTYTGCPVMRKASRDIRRTGGRVEALIRDPRAGHAGFQENPANERRALAIFRRLVGG
jgi:hypothetical protein